WIMAMNDPLGDMLTRIRNAQMRKRGKVTTPGSSLRKKVLDVLESEGYIRGYSTTDYGNGRTEFEIELKYFDNEPVVIPSGVTAKLEGQTIAVKGAKGELKFTAPQEVALSIDGGAVHVQPHSEDKR